MSISSIAGSLLGSLFYEKMHSYMYAISLMLFVLAFLMVHYVFFHKTSGQKEREQRHLRDELKVGFCVLEIIKAIALYDIVICISNTICTTFFSILAGSISARRNSSTLFWDYLCCFSSM